jgi:hypothetical protein
VYAASNYFRPTSISRSLVTKIFLAKAILLARRAAQRGGRGALSKPPARSVFRPEGFATENTDNTKQEI